MPVQAFLWWTAAAAVLVAIGTGWADRRRARRADLDQVGWAPWGGLSVLALFVAVLALAFAVRG